MYRCDVHKPFRGILRAKELAVVEIHVPNISQEKGVSDIGFIWFTYIREERREVYTLHHHIICVSFKV